MNDSMDALEVFRDVVHSYIINRNGLEFISIRRKYLPDKSDFSTACCTTEELSTLTKYIISEQRTLELGSLFLEVGE